MGSEMQISEVDRQLQLQQAVILQKLAEQIGLQTLLQLSQTNAVQM
jgi:hypothetical protein